jgi:hypothetical protein
MGGADCLLSMTRDGIQWHRCIAPKGNTRAGHFSPQFNAACRDGNRIERTCATLIQGDNNMSTIKTIGLAVLALFAAMMAAGTEASAQQRSGVRVEGQVQAGGGPLASSTVTLWAASAGEPKQLAQTKSGSDGRFELRTADTPGNDVVLYVVAKGGIATAKTGSADNPATALLAVLGNQPPAKIVINELTTVASAFTAARFIKGEAISGNPLGLRIAAGNAPNLVDPVTGGWGKVLLDPINSSMTTTMAKLDTLGALITYAIVANDDWRALPQGRHSDRRRDSKEYARSDGRHCPGTLGRCQGALRII